MLPAICSFGFKEKIAQEAISLPCALLFCAKQKIAPIANRLSAYVASQSASTVRNQWSQLPSKGNMLGGLIFVGIALWMMRDIEKEEVAEEANRAAKEVQQKEVHWATTCKTLQSIKEQESPAQKELRLARNQKARESYAALNAYLSGKTSA